MRVGLIYKYTNKINNKIYVGLTTLSLNERDKKHQKKSQLNDNTYFHRALKKYGRENFLLELVEDNIPLDLLDDKEKYYIKIYDSYYTSNRGYNLTKGGKRSTPTLKTYGSLEIKIKEYLKNTNLTYKEISKLLDNKVSIDTISSINRGEIFIEDCILYPIRNNPKQKRTTKEDFLKIVELLKESNYTMIEIASIVNVDEYTVHRINHGLLKTFRTLIDLDYPIRTPIKNSTYSNKLTQENVRDICKLIIFENYKSIDICKKYNISKNTLSDISRGLTWKEVTNGLKYPIFKNIDINKQLFT